MMTHTPGPWKFEFGSIVNKNGKLVADVYWSNKASPLETVNLLKERKANADLMAAAPELLQCARYAMADLEGILPEFETGGDRLHPGWQTLKELKAVIHKATGEQA